MEKAVHAMLESVVGADPPGAE